MLLKVYHRRGNLQLFMTSWIKGCKILLERVPRPRLRRVILSTATLFLTHYYNSINNIIIMATSYAVSRS